MRKKLPYVKQYIDKKDISVISKALKKSLVTTGPMVNFFENKIKDFVKSNFAVVCNSGTSAIFLALKAIGLKKGDNVIMPSINFISSYNMSKFFGAKIFLADVDKLTGQVTPQSIEQCCKKFNLKKIKALIVMYNSGYPNYADQFYKLKKKYNCKIVEDACHALGAEYKFNQNKFKIGSCKHSDLCTFSFHPLKTITTGEGGAVTTNSKKYFKKMLLFRSHGIERNKKEHWKYQISDFGFNLRLTDFQCALGISQLKKIDKFVNKRKKIATNYKKKLKKIKDIEIINHNENYVSSHHLFLIHLKNFNHKKKDLLIKYMMKNNIYLQYHYIPIYEFKIFQGHALKKNSNIYYKKTISLPIYYSLSIKEQNYIIKKLVAFFDLR